MNIRQLDADDVSYAAHVWQRAHKHSPTCRRESKWAYQITYGALIEKLIKEPLTVALGAYEDGQLLGFLVMTPGKRVHTLHWCHVKNKLDGERVQGRRDIFFALIDAADLGSKFVYTFQGPRVRKETGARSLDELLVADLRARGITATYVSIKEWLE